MQWAEAKINRSSTRLEARYTGDGRDPLGWQDVLAGGKMT